MLRKFNRAVFLDRDGTIIEDVGYLSNPDDIQFIKNSIPALKILKENGFKIIITTNQSGIERKYLTHKILKKIHDKIRSILLLNNVKIDGIYYCPHLPEKNCHCRKPKPFMAIKAAKDLKINLKKSFCVGDKISDIEFGKNFGAKSILVLTGLGKEERKKIKFLENHKKPDYIAHDLYSAVRWIIRNK